MKDLSGHNSCVRDVAWHPYRNEILSSSVNIINKMTVVFLFCLFSFFSGTEVWDDGVMKIKLP